MPRRRIHDPTTGRASFLWLGPTVVAAATLFLILNYALNAILGTISKEPIRENLRDAFTTGALGIVESRADDPAMGVHQTNDCLVFDMAARDRSDPILYLFAAARTQVVRALPAGNCEALRDWLLGDPIETFKENWYLRYIHGYRAAAIVLLELFPVETAREVMKAASYGVFLLVIVVNLFLLVSRPRGTPLFAQNEVGYILISAVIAGFFGLPYFGQSISHAPALVTLGAFLLGWSVLDRFGRLDERSAIAFAIPFGMLTAYFEFLTGYIPVGVCVIAALVAVAWSNARQPSIAAIFRMLVLTEMAFVGSLVAVFALHVLATALATPDGFATIAVFASRLAFRMSDASESAAGAGGAGAATLTLADVALALLKQITHLGYVSERSGIAAIVAALGISVFGTLDVLASKRDLATKFVMLLAAGSFLPVAAWIFLFQNHTAVHASFMVRILVVVPMAGALAGWMWLRFAPEGRTLSLPFRWRRAVPAGEPAS